MSSRTASPRTPRSARVSAGISWARSVAEERRGRWCGRAAPRPGRPPRTARRSRRGRGAPAGRRAPPRCGGRAQPRGPVGAVPERPEHLLGGAAVGELGAGAGEQAGQPARARRAGSPSRPAERRRVEDGAGGPARGPGVRPVARPRIARVQASARRSRRARRAARSAAPRPGRRRRSRRGVGSSIVGVDDHARARRAAAAPPARGPAGSRRRPPRPGRRRRPAPAAAPGSRCGPSAPAPPSRTSRCRPRGGRGGAGRRCARSRRGRCRR